jgi:hypothetical protein
VSRHHNVVTRHEPAQFLRNFANVFHGSPRYGETVP